MCWARLFDPKSLVRAIPLIKDQGIEEWITGQRSGVWDDCYYLDFSFVSSVSSFSLVKFHVGWTIITRDFYWAQNYHDDSTRWRIILYLLFHSPFLPPWRHEGKGVCGPQAPGGSLAITFTTQQIKVMLSRFTVSFRPFFHVSYSVSSRLYFLPVDLKHSFILVANMMRTGDTIKNERVSIVTTQYALVITDILSLLDM